MKSFGKLWKMSSCRLSVLLHEAAHDSVPSEQFVDVPKKSLVVRSAFSMSRSLVSRVCSLFFPSQGSCCCFGFVALHRVSIRTLDELS